MTILLLLGILLAAPGCRTLAYVGGVALGTAIAHRAETCDHDEPERTRTEYRRARSRTR
jgi:hypothetical protein